MEEQMVEQQELEGMRPKRIAALEDVTRAFMRAKDAHKRTKERVDAAADDCAEALKAAGETVYGFKEGKRFIQIALQDKEAVSLRVTEPKGKKKAAALADEEVDD